LASEAPQDQFIVHEWGTYTSMQGSDGVGQPGLHHGEEPMPEFVHSRADGFKGNYATQRRGLKGILPPGNLYVANHPECGWCKSVDFDPTAGSETEVTQKLETPVLYFYSPRELDVTVDVAFPQGVVTEVYPNMVDYSPAFRHLESLSNGTAKWKVHVLPRKDRLPVPPVPKDHIWTHSRQVTANQVTFGGEVEELIFYRGVGRFQAELQVTSTSRQMTIKNTLAESVSAVFVLESDGEKGYIRALGALPGRQSISTPIKGSTLGDELIDMELFVTRCTVLLEAALLEAGLYPLEARAMVGTWTRSYFRTPGVRVLYVSPQKWANRLLPTTVSPKPDDFVRVLVGRVEVMLSDVEHVVAQQLRELPADAEYNAVKEYLNIKVDVPSMLRFGDAKLRRAAQIAKLSNAMMVNIEKYILLELNE